MITKLKYLILITMFLGACNKKELSTVSNFELDQYLGTWYEVARLPNSFEKDLKCVTATYSLRDNGKINVFNKGFNQKKQKWEDITGYAKVPDDQKPAEIKVTFFWPFAGDYYVIDIDKDYQTALVGAPNRKYLWLLSRKPNIPSERLEELKKIALDKGFDTNKLEMIEHNCD